jgi:hypothetical protein
MKTTAIKMMAKVKLRGAGFGSPSGFQEILLDGVSGLIVFIFFLAYQQMILAIHNKVQKPPKK